MVTELLMGAGIALFIAILAWGNQIRSVQKDTREIERELIETKKLSWQDIRFLIRENELLEDRSEYGEEDLQSTYQLNEKEAKLLYLKLQRWKYSKAKKK